MDILIVWDQELLTLINQGWSSSFLDSILPIIRNKYLWYPIYITIIFSILFRFELFKGLLLIATIFSCVVFTDLVSSQIIKKYVQRIRPCNELVLVPQVDERINCGYGYSFPSSHAANHTALATIIIILMDLTFAGQFLLIFWVFLICYAQVYVGVHYPLDILGGILLGILLGRLSASLYRYFNNIKRPLSF